MFKFHTKGPSQSTIDVVADICEENDSENDELRIKESKEFYVIQSSCHLPYAQQIEYEVLWHHLLHLLQEHALW